MTQVLDSRTVTPRPHLAPSRTGVLACVIGDIDLVSALRLAGVPTALVAPADDPAQFSKAVVDRVAWAHPRQHETLVAHLLDFADRRHAPLALYYQYDAALLLVSRHRHELRKRFAFVIADEELVEASVDKARFAALADAAGLPVPRARVVRGTARPSGFDDLAFPLIVKPVTHERPARMGTRAKAVQVATPREMEDRWPAWREAGAELLIQELVAGPETAVESYHAYVDASGRIAGEFTGAKIRTFPAEFGHSSLLVTTDAPDVREAGRDAVRRLGVRGVIKLDYKRDPAGRLWLLEANPRFTLWHHLGAAGGTNLAALVHSDLTGSPRPAVTPVPPGLVWCHPLRDFRAAQEAGVPVGAWLRAVAGAHVRSGMSLRDPLPFARGMLWPVVRRRLDRPHLLRHGET